MPTSSGPADKSFWDAIHEVLPDERERGSREDEYEGDRLQKVLARVGFGSRRVCENLISARRVLVNGDVAVLGRRVDPINDEIRVDGVVIGAAPDLVHYLLNKPAGVVSTSSDTHGRPTVVDLVPAEPRVFSIGRLDAETEGLIILTNDGPLSQQLTHPSTGVEKEYLAHVAVSPSPAALRRLREGVELEDGMTAPAKATLVAPDVVRLVIHEGKNRQVRRMLDAVHCPVQRLVRTRIGTLRDDRLAPGQWRPLTIEEVRALSAVSRPSRAQRRSDAARERDAPVPERG